MAMLDPELLQAFVAIADHRSFTRAANALNRTQSAVSMQIKRLEERLGAELFHRSTAAVQLSTAGESLLGYARRIIAMNEEAIAQLRSGEARGVVRLGVMEDYGTLFMPELLASFSQWCPHVQVELHTGLTAFMVDRLGNEFDLVVAMHAEGEGQGQLLHKEKAVWATGRDSAVDHEADCLPLALYPDGCLLRKWATDALDASHRNWRMAFVSPNLRAVEAIAAQGLAVTVVKNSMVPSRLRRLSQRHGLPALPRADIRLHRARHLQSAATLLGDHIARGLTPLVFRSDERAVAAH